MISVGLSSSVRNSSRGLISVKEENKDPETDCDEVEFGDFNRCGLCDRNDEACDLDESTILVIQRQVLPHSC